jgi:hypothetical protein
VKSKADNVGGIWVTRPANQTPKAQAIAFALSHPWGVGDAHFRNGASKPQWVDTVPFGGYREEVFDNIGLYEESLVRNQDDELNHRLIKRGGRHLARARNLFRVYGQENPLESSGRCTINMAILSRLLREQSVQ